MALKSQLNFWFVGTDFPFINHLKTGQNWAHVSNNARPDPDLFNSDGYPTSIVSGGYYTVFDIPNQTDRPGNWAVRWTGNITVLFNFTHTVVSGSKSGLNGKVVFTPTGSVVGNNALRIDFRITGITTAPTSIEFYHVDDEGRLDAGEVFNYKFLQKIREGNFGVLRFLDWIAGTNPIPKWTYRKPSTYWSYKADEARSSLWAGTTTRSVNAYSVAAPSGWVLEDKACLLLKFDSAGSGTGTLDVGGTGAKTILGWYGTAWDTSAIEANGIAFAVYEADLNGYMIFGADGVSRYIPNGFPIEIMVRLCNELNVHPWFNIPYLSLDPIQDFTQELASYCKTNLNLGLVPRFEPTNEVWNPGAGFYATTYAGTKSTARWGSSDYNNWYGMVLSTMGQAVKSVYVNDTSKYQVICGVWTYGPDQTTRLSSALYVAEGGIPASAVATHVACTGYWRPASYNTAAETTFATNYAAASAADKVKIAREYLTERQSTSTNITLASVKDKYLAWASFASKYRLKLTMYEGGYDAIYTSDTDKDALREAAKSLQEMKELTLRNYNNFIEAGGECPSCYMFVGNDAVWSVFDPTIYSTPSPQWDAIVEFNGLKPIQGGVGSSKKHFYVFPDGTMGWASPEEADMYLNLEPVKKSAPIKLEVARLIDLLPKTSEPALRDAARLIQSLDELEEFVKRLEEKVASLTTIH